MRNWIRKLLRLDVSDAKVSELDYEINSIKDNVQKSIASINRRMEEYRSYMDKVNGDMADVNGKIGVKIVSKKFKGWTSEQEFYELSTRIYILDDGWRKQNKPFVKSDENGVVDEYPNDFGSGSKMRCYMLKKLILVGYGNPEDLIIKGADRDNFEYMFGKSYRELVSYMREFNYEKLDEGICSLNFYEI